MTVILFPDQREWVAEIAMRFRSHRRVLGQACTGFGKTVCFSDIVRRTVERGGTVTVVAHRIEIVSQIGAALSRAGVRFGWVMPSKPASREAVLVGMVQAVANRLATLKQPRLLVVDEAHHATAGSYQKLMEAWPSCYVLGVTASPQRTDGTGLGACFDAMVVGPSMKELIARDRLAGFRYFAPQQKADLSAVRTRAGDYAQDQLAAVMDQAAVTGDAVASYAERLGGKPAIAFCVSVEHSRHVAEQFAAAGWKAASVDGSTDRMVRSDLIAAIGDGRLNVLTSCDIISEGTDIPAVSGAILLRPTQSLIVYLQQVGRVLRRKADGSPAIINDHCGNVFRHGLPDEDREWSLDGRKQRRTPLAVAQCPKCYRAHAPAPSCPSCGYADASRPAPARRALEQREGVLEQVDGARLEQLQGARLQEALRVARALKSDGECRVALEKIGRAMGYKPNWVFMQMQLRRQFRGGAGRQRGAA